MVDEDIKAELTKREYYPSTLAFIKGDIPKKDFWRYFVKIDFRDHWNWICLMVAILLFWWSFRTIFAAFV